MQTFRLQRLYKKGEVKVTTRLQLFKAEDVNDLR